MSDAVDHRDHTPATEQGPKLLVSKAACPQRRQHRWRDEHDAHTADCQAGVQLARKTAPELNILLAEPDIDPDLAESEMQLVRCSQTIVPGMTEEGVALAGRIGVNDVSDITKEVAL